MPLPKPGDPYVSSKGQVVLPKKEHAAAIEIGPPRAKNIMPSVRRSIKDFPADENTQKAINVVMVFSLLGMTENEIAFALNVKLEDVRRLRELTTYQETFELLFSEMISINSTSMQAKIAAFAPKALENLMDLANDAENENAKVKANQDLMDRAGLHHETLYGKNASDDAFSSLKIVISDGDEQKTDIEVNIGKKR
jgi:hypothetical protein